MDFLKTETAVLIVRRLRLVAEYVPGAGARCTLCGEWNPAESGAKVLKSGKRIRYHVCLNCCHKFKSEEKTSQEYSYGVGLKSFISLKKLLY